MSAAPAYAFDPFSLDPASRALTLHGVPIALRPKTIELLECFLARAGRIVTKHELIDALWPDGAVTEQNLAQQVFLLRAVLSEHAPGRAFVVTVPGRGYRFVAPVDVRPPREDAHSDLQRLYLRGRYHAEKRTRAGLAAAQACFERAIALDPGFAPALSGLASTQMLRGEFLFELSDRAFPAARRTALRSLAIDPKQPEALTVLGDIALFYDRDGEEAERYFDAALAVDARYRTARLFHAWLCMAEGRFAQSRLELETALVDTPYDMPMQTALGVLSLYQRDVDAAVAQLRFVLDLEPSYHLASYYLAGALAYGERYEEALATIATDDTGEYAQANAGVGAFAAYRLGDRERGRRYEQVIELAHVRGEQLSAFNRAQVALGKRDVFGAIATIAAATAEHDPWLVFIPEHPVFAELRADARYARTLARIPRSVRSAYGTC
ncbi:MAG TPA: winged helix-turn-helix domain-containing protein [Candidatus Elarobacter sp.]